MGTKGRLRSCVLVCLTLVAGSAWAGDDKVAVCHAPEAGEPHTILVGAPAVGAHLAHGDTEGECGSTTGACPCVVIGTNPLWQLTDYISGGLYCTANVPSGRLRVCTVDGVAVCEEFARDGGVPYAFYPLEDCAACLPATVTRTDGTFTIDECSQVPDYLPY